MTSGSDGKISLREALILIMIGVTVAGAGFSAGVYFRQGDVATGDITDLEREIKRLRGRLTALECHTQSPQCGRMP